MPELLSPAGNFEKLRAALLYGADAVYLAGTRFGMRSAADNFTIEELYQASEYTHSRNKKLYITINTLPHGSEYPALTEYLHAIKDAKADGYIVADLGVFALIRKIIPDAELHISTQASIISPEAANMYASLGAKRLVLARELCLSEIAEIRASLDKSVELEAFIHGSMCVSYSGRCMLSSFLTGRDANRGACTQPCRWGYKLTEEKRPDIPIPIEENENGTFIMSSKDMCTIEHIPELMQSGIDSFKIEGRMKSAYYAAVTANTYRIAIDEYLKNPAEFKYNPAWLTELNSVSHREYCTGYYFDSLHENAQLCSQDGYIREKAYYATAQGNESPLPNSLIGVCETPDGKLYKFIQRNKISRGNTAELISPGYLGKRFTVTDIYSENGEPLESAPHPSQIFWLRVPFEVKDGDILRSGGNE